MTGVIVTTRKRPDAALTRDAANLLDELAATQPTPGRVARCQRAAKELRTSADYIETLEGKQMAKRISSADFEPTPRRKAITANRGASLNRQSVVARLRRDKTTATASVRDYIDSFIAWVNGQTIRAKKKAGGL